MTAVKTMNEVKQSKIVNLKENIGAIKDRKKNIIVDTDRMFAEKKVLETQIQERFSEYFSIDKELMEQENVLLKLEIEVV